MFGTWKSVLIGVVVAASVLTIAAEADAHWGYWNRCGPMVGSCVPVCTPCYTATCDPCGSWSRGCRPGPIRRALLGPYRWYYTGGRGLFGCGCGCACDVCTVEASCCSQATVTAGTFEATAETGVPTKAEKPPTDDPPDPPATADPSPAGPVDPPMTPDVTAPGTFDQPATRAVPDPPLPSGTLDGTPETDAALTPIGNSVSTRENSGLLTIWVPADAKVTINGLETKSQGSRREYVSYGLKPGFAYSYEIRASIVRNGQVIQDQRTVTLAAGDQQGVAFGFNLAPVQGLAAR